MRQFLKFGSLAIALLLLQPLAACAEDAALSNWQIEASRVRGLAENDILLAYTKALRLRDSMPATATPADRTRILNLLARIELYLGKSDSTEKYAREAFALAQANDDRAGQAEADLNIALNAVNQSRFDVMSDAIKHSMSILDGVNRPELLAEAMLRTSMMFRRFERLDDSVEMAIRAMDMAKRSSSAVVQVYAYQGMAIAYDQSEHGGEARDYYKKMRGAAQAAHSRLMEGDALLGLGSILGGTGDIKSGERLIREAVALYREAGGPFYLAHAQHALADNLRKQGRLAEAQATLGEVVRIYEEKSNKVGLWWALRLRGTMYTQQGRTAEGKANAERIYRLGREIGHPYYMATSARTLAENVAATGDFRRAYLLNAEAAEMAEKNARQTSAVRMLDLSKRFEDESRQRQIDELTRDRERQELSQRWLWTVLAATMLVLGVIAYSFAHLRRNNAKLKTANTDLALSRSKLQGTLDAIPDLMFEVDLDGRYYEAHAPSTDLLAAPVEQLLGKTIREVMPAEAAEICMSALREANEKGGSFGKQMELPLPHGRFWFELSVARKTQQGSPVPRFIAISRDITARKLAEEALAGREREFRTLAENIPDHILRYDLECRATYMNATHAVFLGNDAARLLGKEPHESYPDGRYDEYQIRMAGVIATGHPAEIEIESSNDGNVTSYHQVRLVAERDEKGEIAGVLAIGRDITERKRAERDLMLLNSAVNASSESTFLMDDQGRFVYVNDAACRGLGYDRETLLGMSPLDIDPGLTPQKFDGLLNALFFQGADPTPMESSHRARDGRVFPIEIVGSSLKLDGRNYGLSMVRDISERKAAERKLDEYRERLEELVEERTLALSESKARMTALIDNLPFEFWGMDCNLRYIMQNAVSLDNHGSLVGKRIEELGLPEEVAAQRIEQDRKALAGEILRAEYAKEVAGETRIYESMAAPVRVGDEVIGIVGVGIDITERKRMEETLASHEREFRSLAENVPDNIARWDAEGRYLYINPTHERLLGVHASDVIGTKIPDSHDAVKAAIARAVATGQRANTVRQPLLVNGNTQLHDVTLVPEFDESGRIVSVLGIGRDMTGVYRMQETIAARERELRALAESSPGMMGSFYQKPDGSLCMPYVSPKIFELFGLHPEDVAEDATRLMALTHPEDAQRVMDTIAESASAMTPWHCEYRILHPTKGLLWVESNTSPQPHPDGGTIWYGYVHDITDRKRMEAEKRRLIEMMEQSVDFVGMADMQGRLFYHNPTALRMVGLAEEADVSGMRIADIHPAWVTKLIQETAIPETVKHGVWRGETAVIHRDGHEIPVFQTLMLHRDAQGNPEYTSTIMQDISERKRVEHAHEEIRGTLQSVLKTIPDLVWMKDVDGVYLSCNHEFERFFGAKESEIVGKTDYDFVDAELADFFRQKDQDAIAAKQICMNEEWVTYADDGRRVLLEARKVPVYGEDGRVTGVLGVSRDITERRRMEEKLAVREQEFRALAENSPDTIARYIHGGIRTYINPLFAKLAGKPAHEMLGVTAADYQPTPQALAYHNALRHSLQSGEEGECEYTWPTHDGRLITSHIRIVPEFGADGKVASVLAVGRDITERKRMEAALKESETRFRYHFNQLQSMLESSSTVSVFALDREYRYLFFNKRHKEGAKRIRGTDIAIGMNMIESIPDEAFGEYCRMGFDRVLAGNSVFVESKEKIDKEGTLAYEYNDNFGSPIFNDEGEVIGLTVFSINTTERKQMEEALQRSEQLMRTVIDATPDWIFIKDREHRYQLVNKGYANALHRAPEDFIGKDDLDLGFPEELVKGNPEKGIRGFWADDRLVLDTNETQVYPDDPATIDGAVHTFHTIKVPLQDANGKAGSVLAFARDITERKQLESELRASRNFLDSVIDSVSDPIFVKDRQHRWTLLNDAFCAFIGRPRETLLGKSDYDFFPREQADVFWEKDESVFDSGESNLNEEGFTSTNGEEHYIQTKKTPFVSGDGREMLVGVIRDITERKHLEAAREVALAEAQRLAKLRSEFIAHMSHELRTPLNGILGYAQMLGRDDTLNEKQLASVEVIRLSGEHLLMLIEDILDLARIESDRLKLDIDAIPVAKFLQIVSRIIGVKAHEKKIEFACELSPDLPPGIRGDEKRLRQVLLNLLSNAVKFTDQGKVTLSVIRVAPSRFAFAVSDTGIGIAPAEREAIFQPFEQVSDARYRVGGTGLGLSISRQLVRLMGGDIAVESHPGAGSTFRFELELPETGMEPKVLQVAADDAWHIEASQVEAAPPPLIAPPQEEMQELHRLALLGNMRDIAGYAERIGQMDPRYRPFSEHLKRLVDGFQSKAILAFVESNLI